MSKIYNTGGESSQNNLKLFLIILAGGGAAALAYFISKQIKGIVKTTEDTVRTSEKAITSLQKVIEEKAKMTDKPLEDVAKLTESAAIIAKKTEDIPDIVSKKLEEIEQKAERITAEAEQVTQQVKKGAEEGTELIKDVRKVLDNITSFPGKVLDIPADAFVSIKDSIANLFYSQLGKEGNSSGNIPLALSLPDMLKTLLTHDKQNFLDSLKIVFSNYPQYFNVSVGIVTPDCYYYNLKTNIKESFDKAQEDSLKLDFKYDVYSFDDLLDLHKEDYGDFKSLLRKELTINRSDSESVPIVEKLTFPDRLRSIKANTLSVNFPEKRTLVFFSPKDVLWSKRKGDFNCMFGQHLESKAYTLKFKNPESNFTFYYDAKDINTGYKIKDVLNTIFTGKDSIINKELFNVLNENIRNILNKTIETMKKPASNTVTGFFNCGRFK